MGTQQSGVLALRIADIMKDTEILKIARSYALQVLKGDINLEQQENKPIRIALTELTSIRISGIISLRSTRPIRQQPKHLHSLTPEQKTRILSQNQCTLYPLQDH